MATGGIVIQIPNMSDGSKEQQIAGLCQEWLDRLDTIGGTLHPRKEDLGSTDKKLTTRWQRYAGGTSDRQCYLFTSKHRQLKYWYPSCVGATINSH
jgi:hypothetical protein